MSKTITKTQAEIEALLAEARAHDADAAHSAAQAELAGLELWSKQRQQQMLVAGDWSNRVLNLDTAIDEASSAAFQANIRTLARTSSAPITVIINSPGGHIVEGFAMIDSIAEIQAAGINVTMKVRGEACSMAGVLLQAASPGCRIVGRNSTVMVHKGGLGAFGATHEVEDRVEYMKRLLVTIADLFERANTKGKDAKFFLDLFEKRKDIYFTAEEAVELGIADAVG